MTAMAQTEELRAQLSRLVTERDEAYTRMRRLIPAMDKEPVDVTELTAAQRSAVSHYERLEATVRELRTRIYR
jgi:hypothetical protein